MFFRMQSKTYLVSYFFLLLLVEYSQSGMNQCKSALLKGCTCEKTYFERSMEFVVNCTDQGFDNVKMLEKLPEETTVLIFNGNHIPTLPWNIFGDLKNLTYLKIIDMSNNQIKEIKGKAYHHVPNVERLILNHNNLTISNKDDDLFHHPRIFSNFLNLLELHLTNTFADNTDAALADDLHEIFVSSDLKKLIKLHLEQNEIKNFRDQNVFCDLPSLQHLYLADNYLPSINFNVLCLKRLLFLDLENNNITKFAQSDLDTLDKLSYPSRTNIEPLMIDLRGNPFHCDSVIKNFFTWMHSTNVTVRSMKQLQCHQNKYGNKYIMNLRSLGMAKHAKLSQAIVVLLVILVLILISLLGAYAYVSKDKLRTKLTPIMDAVSRKVQYTTIESQDV